MAFDSRSFRRYELIVLLFASIIFIGCIVSPPSLMDDVDATQASIARTMLETGDWVTPHLNGVKYMEKPPLKYWIIAIFFKFFGVHDYIARLPLALTTVLLCWLTFRVGVWAFGSRAGFYAGLVLSTCIGLFLFTRVLIADVQLTFTTTLAIWSFLRAMDQKEPRARLWGLIFWASVGTGLLLKGLIGALFPFASAFLFLLFTKQLLVRETWHRLAPIWGILVLFAIAAPWHILATLHNPPYFHISLQSGPGNYHGFFWFYFFNEHILRFLNRRYPHDYDTVPRLYFWVFQLLWLFPWSTYFPALLSLNYRPVDRASRTRLMAVSWIVFLMAFFTLSTTQEYYSMPAYPAMALLMGCAIASAKVEATAWLKRGDATLLFLCTLAAGAIIFILSRVWRMPSPGDISKALTQNPAASYTLSLGHMGDLTLQSFAYLRTPLILALLAFLLGVSGLVFFKAMLRVLALASMMLLFFHAARLAMVTFDPYLSSRSLAEALLKSPPGVLIAGDQYYTFSSVFFYANRKGFLLNGRVNNLEYGSNAPGAPQIFITDADLVRMWKEPQRCYLLVERPALSRIKQVIPLNSSAVVKESGGKYLLTNMSLTYSVRDGSSPGKLINMASPDSACRRPISLQPPLATARHGAHTRNPKSTAQLRFPYTRSLRTRLASTVSPAKPYRDRSPAAVERSLPVFAPVRFRLTLG
jgi:4-amino-4-deoxy-L-arabinose transferase-like glycosyltransferase